MAGKKTGKRILTALIVILVLILSLGLLSRLIGVSGNQITLTYAGESYKSSASGLEIAPRSEFGVKLRDKSASYEVKIYALGTEENDFAFTVGGTEYSWSEDIAGANGGRGEEFTDAFEVEKTDAGFTISCGVEKALRDIWAGEEIVLPEEIPAGDRFRLEVTSGKTTLTVSFSVKEPGTIGVEKIELNPGEIVF
jgi:hypothetical protein